jgi:hypothetical protein
MASAVRRRPVRAWQALPRVWVSRVVESLFHLPTDTIVEIRDGREGSHASISVQVSAHRERPNSVAAWREDVMTLGEQQWDSVWRVDEHTSLYSAWFHLMPVFDNMTNSQYARHAVLHPAHAPQGRAVLSWCGTMTPTAACNHLQALQIAVNGAALTVHTPAENFAIVRAGGAAMELHQRAACSRCRPSRDRWSPHRRIG